MVRRVGRSGEGRLGCVVWVLTIVALGFVMWQAVPAKIHSVEFYDFLDDQAKFAQRASPDILRQRILQRAKELAIPLDPKALKIEKSDTRIRIECHYALPIELPGYTYSWHFEHRIDEPIFTF